MIAKKFLESRQGVILPVHVKPGSKGFAVEGCDKWRSGLVVRLQERPEKGKANRELLEKLRMFFNSEVEILKGEKNRKKILLVKANKKQFLETLSQI